LFTPATKGPLVHESIVKGGAFTPDGQRLATITRQGVIHIWDLLKGQPWREPCPTGLTNLERVIISPCGRYLLAFSPSSTAAFLRLDDPKAVCHLLPHAYSVGNAAFSPDGELLAIQKRTRFGSLAHGRLAAGLSAHQHRL